MLQGRGFSVSSLLSGAACHCTELESWDGYKGGSFVDEKGRHVTWQTMPQAML